MCKSLIVLLILLSSCGSVQTINGVKLKGPKESIREEVTIAVFLFGAGYYAQKEYQIVKRK